MCIRDREIRRWLLPDAKAYREKIDEMPAEERPSAEQIAELDAAIAQGEDALNMTIADPAKADAAKERLTNILVELGQREPAKETSEAAYALEKVCCVLSLIALKTIGSQGYSDVARVVIKFLIKFIASVI